MLAHETFMAHLTHLSTSDPVDIARLYQQLDQNTPWPRLGDGALLNPLSIIVHGMAQLSQRFRPDEDPLAIPEVGAMSQAVGRILNQFTIIATVVDVALMPGIVEGDTADAIGLGMNTIAEEIAEVLGHRLATAIGIEESAKNGEEEAEAAESPD